SPPRRKPTRPRSTRPQSRSCHVLRMLARALCDGHDSARLMMAGVPHVGGPEHNGRIAQRKSIRLTTGRPQVRSLLRPQLSNIRPFRASASASGTPTPLPSATPASPTSSEEETVDFSFRYREEFYHEERFLSHRCINPS